jgi:hypothetical protein
MSSLKEPVYSLHSDISSSRSGRCLWHLRVLPSWSSLLLGFTLSGFCMDHVAVHEFVERARLKLVVGNGVKPSKRDNTPVALLSMGLLRVTPGIVRSICSRTKRSVTTCNLREENRAGRNVHVVTDLLVLEHILRTIPGVTRNTHGFLLSSFRHLYGCSNQLCCHSLDHGHQRRLFENRAGRNVHVVTDLLVLEHILRTIPGVTRNRPIDSTMLSFVGSWTPKEII